MEGERERGGVKEFGAGLTRVKWLRHRLILLPKKEMGERILKNLCKNLPGSVDQPQGKNPAIPIEIVRIKCEML